MFNSFQNYLVNFDVANIMIFLLIERKNEKKSDFIPFFFSRLELKNMNYYRLCVK